MATTFQLTLEGQPGVTYSIERSADLVTWTLVGTVVAAEAPVTFTDNALGDAVGLFYRAVVR